MLLNMLKHHTVIPVLENLVYFNIKDFDILLGQISLVCLLITTSLFFISLFGILLSALSYRFMTFISLFGYKLFLNVIGISFLTVGVIAVLAPIFGIWLFSDTNPVLKGLNFIDAYKYMAWDIYQNVFNCYDNYLTFLKICLTVINEVMFDFVTDLNLKTLKDSGYEKQAECYKQFDYPVNRHRRHYNGDALIDDIVYLLSKLPILPEIFKIIINFYSNYIDSYTVLSVDDSIAPSAITNYNTIKKDLSSVNQLLEVIDKNKVIDGNLIIEQDSLIKQNNTYTRIKQYTIVAIILLVCVI